MAAESETCQKFDNLSLKFSCLLYGRTEKQQQYINYLLDELNSLNFKLPVVTNINKAVLLVHQICTIVPATDTELVKKCCVLITSLITQQRISIEERTLSFTVDWITQNLKQTENYDISVLQCLECVIRDNVDKIQDHLSELIGNNGILLKLSKNASQDVQLWAVKCLEAIVYCKDEQKDPLNSVNYLEICSQIFLTLLSDPKPSKINEIIYCKLTISCLRGVQSILTQSVELESHDLGSLLGISRCYMTYCLFDSDWVKPQKIMPSNLSIADLTTSSTREKKGGKITKQRKQRKSNSHKKEDSKRVEKGFLEPNNSSYTPATLISENTLIVISDSDYSDSETGNTNKISVGQGRVRQAALNMLLSIVKVTDKHVMFGYWSSFFPDGSPAGVHSLNRCLLQEPSPRGRIAALNVISTILNGSKLYLSQAETSEKTFAFTPFSMILGSMIKELHQCLCLALKDNSIPVLTQVLKCLALLVQATPYHRLTHGLINNVITNVKPFIRHRDATVQVAALIVLGCVVASEPVVQETISNLSQNTNNTLQPPLNISQSEFDQEIEFVAFSSDEEDCLNIQEPITNIPWLLEKCLRNLGAVPLKKNNIVPAPVKLESLQVISAMCRNYFHVLLAPHIMLVAKSIEISLGDKYIDLRLHAGRAIDSIGHAMQPVSSPDDPKQISIEKGLQFWQILLNGPLTSLVQSDQNATLRSIGCDCLGSIGSEFFEHLPKDKQLLIITSLFSCSRDDENSVKGAAVRALAISVLYPTLREDLGFVMDTVEAIIRTLEDPNLAVRIKSSWSLGNLSDALVLYKKNSSNEDLPDSLLYKLLLSCNKIVDDNNKIKSNAVRALGNLLRLVTVDLLVQEQFKEITVQSIKILVKNSVNCSDMKVRWNSCYAIGNFMKNNDLFAGNVSWQQNVYPVLMDLVANFRNFKVRINAALAFSIPEKRSHYGNYYFSIWKSLLNALDNSQNIEDFNEFKHRDNLIDQICLSISHLTTLLAIEDLIKVNELIVCHIDALKIQMHRVQERLVPEKSEILLRAANHINNLKIEHLSNDQQSILLELQNIFYQNDV